MKTKLLLMISLILAINQGFGQITAPVNYTDLGILQNSNFSLPILDSVTWIKLNTDTNKATLSIAKLNTSPYSINQVTLYAERNGALEILMSYSLRNLISVDLNTNNTNENENIFIKLESTLSCEQCSKGGIGLSLNVVLLPFGCGLYNHPTCELVRDGSMEFYNVQCSQMRNNVNNVLGTCFWTVPNSVVGLGTSDYNNSCAPVNVIGCSATACSSNSSINFLSQNQQGLTPQQGQGYLGAFLYLDNPSLDDVEYREYIVNQLQTPMLANNTYVIRMHVRLAQASAYAISNIQMLLTNGVPTQQSTTNGTSGLISSSTGDFINTFTNFTTVTNKNGWTLLTATVTPTINRTHITIGNFRGKSQTGATMVAPANSIILGAGNLGFSPNYFFAGAYYYFDNVSIRPINTLTVSPQNIEICQGTTVTFTTGLINNNQPINPIGNYNFSSNPNDNSITYLTPNHSSTNVTPNVTTTYSITATDAIGCTSSTTAVVTVLTEPNFTITPTANVPNICPIQPATLTATGAQSYTWQPGNIVGSSITVNPTVPTTYTVYGTGSNGCVAQNTITVNPATCCNQGATTITQTTLSSNLLPGNYNLNQALTITGNVLLSNVTIFMGSNAEIILANGARLELRQSHLLGCPNMWKGIRAIGPSATIRMTSNCMIEDAYKAIDLDNVTSPSTGQQAILFSENVIFNKNYFGVWITNYQNPTIYPAYINNTTFTSRKLITPQHLLVNNTLTQNFPWPTGSATDLKQTNFNPSNAIANNPTSGISQQFSAANAPSSNLEIPYQNQTAGIGIYLDKVGTNNLNVTTFYGFQFNNIGNQNNTSQLNLFDNLYVGVYAKNSNFKSTNAGYQYMKAIPITDPTTNIITYYGGSGIEALNDLGSAQFYNLEVVQAAGILPNAVNFTSNFFFNNVYSVKAEAYQYVNINKTITHSNRVYNTSEELFSFIPFNGRNGIYVTTPDYRRVNINQNYVTNVRNGIIFNSGYVLKGKIAVQRRGNATVDNNVLRANYSTPTNQALNTAIATDNINPCPSCIQDINIGIPNTFSVSVSNNKIFNAFSGITASNWDVPNNASNNTITLRVSPNSSATQFGIAHNNCARDIVNNNTITGFNVTRQTVYAIWLRDNNLQTVTCNNTSTTFEGFRFQGAQNLTLWEHNSMRSHRRGMHLNNTVIGQQGTSTRPINNVWEAQGNGWSGINRQTYVTTNQTSTNAINSRLFVRNNTLNKPSNNDANLAGQQYGLNSIINASGFNFRICQLILGPVVGPVRNWFNLVSTPVVGRNTLVKLAYDSISYLNFEPSLRQNAKRQVYKLLAEDADLSTNDVDLQQFYNQQNTSNIGKFEQIEQALFNANTSQAQQLQQNLSAQTLVDDNTKNFYNLYLKVIDSTFTNMEDTALLQLANACPDKDGLVVFQARAMYNALHSTYYQFEDNCEEVKASRMSQQEDNNSQFMENSVFNSLAVYPNPNQGNFTIHFEEANTQKLNLKIYDVNGRLVFIQNEVLLEGLDLPIHTNLKTGIYLLQVNDVFNETEYKQKLIITE